MASVAGVIAKRSRYRISDIAIKRPTTSQRMLVIAAGSAGCWGGTWGFDNSVHLTVERTGRWPSLFCPLRPPVLAKSCERLRLDAPSPACYSPHRWEIGALFLKSPGGSAVRRLAG